VSPQISHSASYRTTLIVKLVVVAISGVAAALHTHSREKVWRAVTEPEQLAVWFPQEIVGDRRAGAPLRFVSSAGGGFDGQMLVFDPPSVMEFTWGAGRLRIELQAEEAGTLLTLTDTFDDLGKAARDAAGWHDCLDRLASGLDGIAPPAWGHSWRQINEACIARFGPDASVIGPPPGWEEHTTASRA
jgi:uncharacterized protein YndB with AHSA1/START domain